MTSALGVLVTVLLGQPSAEAQPEPKPVEIQAIKLRVALVEDPDFPSLDDGLIARALDSAAGAFAERFGVERSSYSVAARFTLDGFMHRYARPEVAGCEDLYSVAYHGGGRDALLPQRIRAIKFFQRWSLDDLRAFLEEDRRASVKTYEDLWEHYVRRYLATVEKLEGLKTPNDTPLLDLKKAHWRSHAAWSCASRTQRDYDLILTNAFIFADLLSEPHPHTVFGKAKIGGLAGPNAARAILGGQALVASTFAIDTPIEYLSELGGKPATLAERGEILGAYLIAHEVAHAIFGIPDVFDHPPSCLMTSRPGETYREGLATLAANPGPCPRCRPWVEARSALDRGRSLLEAGDAQAALKMLSQASKQTPKQLHGGYKRRMAAISVLVSNAYARLGQQARAKSFAQNALDLDPTSDEARDLVAKLTSTKKLPKGGATATSSSARESRNR
jgi:hypothetical protein